MLILESDIYQITESIWEVMLGMPVARQDEASPVDAGDDSITGCIEITGAWEVTVLMECSTELARKATARMFDKAAHEVKTDEMRDAVGELTNMIGGGFKGLLPRTCFLSMPVLLDENDLTLPSQVVACEVTFVCEKQPLRVRLLIPNDHDALESFIE